jgi:hypothetical protein
LDNSFNKQPAIAILMTTLFSSKLRAIAITSVVAASVAAGLAVLVIKKPKR